MLIVDSQVHLWKAETPERPWQPGARDRMATNGHLFDAFTYEECLEKMDEAGVDRVLIVPPSWEGDRIDYGIEAAEKYPARFAVMARVPQNKPNEAKAMMRDWSQIPGVKGVRMTFHRPVDRDWLVDGTCDWYWPFAEELGVPTMVHAPTWKKELAAIADGHPGLKMIVDHMGLLVHSTDEKALPWIEDTAALASCPNVYVKVSAVPTYSTESYPYPMITAAVRDLIKTFGASRCFWGTDITRILNTKGITYRQTVEQFTEHMGLGETELRQVMGEAICDCLNWSR